MKKIKVLFAFFVVFCLIFNLSACKSGSEDEYSYLSVWVDDESGTTTSEKTDSNVSSNTSNVSSSSKPANQTSKNPSKNNSSNELLSSVPRALRGTTVELFTWIEMKNIDGAKKVVDNFKKETGITVKWSVVGYRDYDTLLNSRMAAGNPPDFVLNNQLVISRMRHYQPISNLKYDFSDPAWDQQTMKDFTIYGKPYAIMLNYKYTLFNQPQVIFYNKDLISKYDLTDPYKLWKQGNWNMDTMINMCKIFKEETGKPGWSIGSSWEWIRWNNMSGPFGFDGVTVTNNLKNNSLVKAYQKLCDYRDSGYLSDVNLDVASLQKGDLLFLGYNMSNARTSNSSFSGLKSSGALGIVPLPIGANTVVGEYESYSIPKGAKNAEAVPYFLRYYLDKSNYDEKSFFAVSNGMEVYNYCMAQNRITNTINLLGNSGSGIKTDELGSNVWKATSASVTTEIAKSASALDAEVSKLNNIIAEFK